MIRLDLETRSHLDLNKMGTYLYAKECELICVAWAVDDRPVQGALCPGEPIPKELWNLLEKSDDLVEAHNANFERAVLHALHKKGMAPNIPLSRWRCTAARAHYANLPGSLERCAQRLQLDHQKDSGGKMAMLKVSQGTWQQADLFNSTAVVHFNEDPALLARTLKYCKQDVETQRAISKTLPYLPRSEQLLWQADQRINDRGVAVDRSYCKKAAAMVDEVEAKRSQHVMQLTSGIGPTQRQKCIEWLEKEEGLYLPNSQKDTLEKVLEGRYPGIETSALSPRAREVLEGMALKGAAPAKKYKKMLGRCGRDSRVRGEYKYAEDVTLRWSAKGVQLHNFAARVDCDAFHKNPQAAYEDIALGDLGRLEEVYGDALACLGLGTRGALVHVDRAWQKDNPRSLAVADYSAIEPRIIAWKSGDHEFLRRIGEGADIYMDMGCGILRIDRDKYSKGDKWNGIDIRSLGKFIVLSLGYGMGTELCASILIDRKAVPDDIDALRSMTYTVVEDSTPGEYDHTPKDELIQLIAKSIITYYKKSREAVPKWWRLEEMHARKVLLYERPQGEWYLEKVGSDTHLVRNMPSGRKLYLPNAWLSQKKEICYLNSNGFERSVYGGKLVSLITQGIARDLMGYAMVLGERHGLRIVMHTHDELVIELRNDGDVERLAHCMNAVPPWARGLPVEAGVVVMPRYAKD